MSGCLGVKTAEWDDTLELRALRMGFHESQVSDGGNLSRDLQRPGLREAEF